MLFKHYLYYLATYIAKVCLISLVLCASVDWTLLFCISPLILIIDL